jgi:hypothetical protein
MFRQRNPQVILLAATMTPSKAIHEDRHLLLNVLGGHTITLPPALGSKARFAFFESVAPTSNQTVIKVANSTDIMQGSLGVTGTTSGTFATTTTSDTITENRTTTGGALAGGWIELIDILSGIWAVRGVLNGSGTVATPFSATV